MSQPASEPHQQLNSTVQNVTGAENVPLNLTAVSSIRAQTPPPPLTPPSQSLPDSQFSTVLQNRTEGEESDSSTSQEVVPRREFTLHASSLEIF